MNKTLAPGERYGEVRIPSSKSIVHRQLICAALGEHEVLIRYDGLSRDIRATADCLNALGAMIPTGLFILMDPANLEKLQTVCSAKYSKSYLTLFAAGILCNVLIHIAVTAKRELITVLCIMCFILCTFEHSIADAGYLPVGGSILKWLVIVAGNTVGGIGTELLVRKESF